MAMSTLLKGFEYFHLESFSVYCDLKLFYLVYSTYSLHLARPQAAKCSLAFHMKAPF